MPLDETQLPPNSSVLPIIDDEDEDGATPSSNPMDPDLIVHDDAAPSESDESTESSDEDAESQSSEESEGGSDGEESDELALEYDDMYGEDNDSDDID